MRLLTPTTYVALAAVLVAGLMAILIHNVVIYPEYAGYDQVAHRVYMQILIDQGRLPSAADTPEYFTPPGFYAIAGAVTLAARHLGANEPWRVARGMNVLWAALAAVFVLLTARVAFPRRIRLQIAALGFFCFLPVISKTATMFHPETLCLAISTLGLYLTTRMVARATYRPLPAVALGLVLGAAQLVRAFALWTTAAALVAILLGGLAGGLSRKRLTAVLGIVVVTVTAVTAPWYVHQIVRYGNPVVFNRAAPKEAVWSRRPLAFYTGLGLPKVFSDPIRPNYVNNILPTVYSDVWGDWFGNFAWGAPVPPEPKVKRQLQEQSGLGLLPTALAVLGLVALAARSILSRRKAAGIGALPLVLLAVAGLLGFLVFTISYPSPDGDVLKATYLLTTTPAWAIAFGYAFDRIARRSAVAGLVLGIVLAMSAVIDLGFLIFHSPLAGVF